MRCLPLLLTVLLSACSALSALSAAEPTRVLFVGNSYSFKAPKLFAQLAESAGEEVEVAQVTKGGWTLQKHADSKETMAKIAESKWDVVIFQEQSQIPSFPDADRRMHGPATKLVEAAKRSGARTIFFETWGRRDGDKRNRKDDTFEAMQKRLTSGYASVARHTGSEIARVGQVWKFYVRKTGSKDLWAKDGSHPSQRGAYLAACVFFSAVFERSAEGAKFFGKLPKADALTYQKMSTAGGQKTTGADGE